MATLIRVDGTTEDVTPANGRTFTLAELQGFVGGYVQMVRTLSGRLLWINEHGKWEDLPRNAMATLIYGYPDYDYIAGDALITESSEVGE